jgi:drug/metabolite transporter (DMT)-like permease
MMALGSGLVFALYALIRSYGRESGDVIGPSMLLIAVAGLGLHFLLEESVALNGTQLLAIAGIGLAPLSVSNMLWDRAARTGQLPLISTIAFLTPFGALLLLGLSGAAAVNASTFAGAVFIVIGAFAAANFFRTEKRSSP